MLSYVPNRKTICQEIPIVTILCDFLFILLFMFKLILEIKIAFVNIFPTLIMMGTEESNICKYIYDLIHRMKSFLYMMKQARQC